MNENIMNEMEVAEVNEVIEGNHSHMNFGTGVATGAIAAVGIYGAIKFGRKLVSKVKAKKAEKTVVTAEVDGKVVEGEVVED